MWYELRDADDRHKNDRGQSRHGNRQEVSRRRIEVNSGKCLERMC